MIPYTNIFAIIGGIFLWCLVGYLSWLYISWLADDYSKPFEFIIMAPATFICAVILGLLCPIIYLTDLRSDINKIKKKLRIK